MSKEKVVSRNIAIALGIIIIILIVGLVGAIANYTSTISVKDSTIATDESQIASLNSQLSTANSTIASDTSTIASLNSQVSTLQSQVSDLTDIANLTKSTVWVDSQTISQPAFGYKDWTFPASYAGYVTFWVQSSTTTNTNVRVIYSFLGVTFDQQKTVHAGVTAVFPVLPASSVIVEVANPTSSGATETVTITYHY